MTEVKSIAVSISLLRRLNHGIIFPIKTPSRCVPEAGINVMGTCISLWVIIIMDYHSHHALSLSGEVSKLID